MTMLLPDKPKEENDPPVEPDLEDIEPISGALPPEDPYEVPKNPVQSDD